MDTTASPLELRQCRDVEIFTTAGLPGVYSRANLETAVRNFYKLGPNGLGFLRPAIGLGHDADQSVLKETLSGDPRLALFLAGAPLDGDDAPAAGWVTSLRTVPDEDDPNETVLRADIVDIPAPIADLIDAKCYRRVSAEIYDDFEAGDGTRYGPALRRVALLGWQPPVNKGVADLPATVAKYGEPTTHSRIRAVNRMARNPGAYTCFSEYRPMTKTDMLAALKGKNLTLSDAAAAAMTDAEVAAIYKKFAEPIPPAPTPVPPPADPTAVNKMDEPPTRDQMIAEMQAAGQDAAQLAALDDATLATMYQQWKAQAATPVATMAEAKKYAETVKSLGTTLAVEVAKAKTLFAEASANAERIKKYAEDTAKAQKGARISGLRLDLCGANGVAYCTPGEFDAIHSKTLATLDDNAVQKFAEPNGKSHEETPFDNYVRKLKSLPPKKVFGERLPDPASAGDPADALAAEKNKVRAYAESNESAVKAFGYTPDKYVARFEELAKKMPGLTAAKYTGQE